jgi:hypothetical protein
MWMISPLFCENPLFSSKNKTTAQYPSDEIESDVQQSLKEVRAEKHAG